MISRQLSKIQTNEDELVNDIVEYSHRCCQSHTTRPSLPLITHCDQSFGYLLAKLKVDSNDMSRASELLASIPLGTRSVIGICTGVFILQTVLTIPTSPYVFCARNVLYLHEFYRIFTSCIFHGGLLHLGFNMTSTSAIGSMLERRCGTARFGLTVLWGILLTSAVQVAAAFLLVVCAGYEGLMNQRSVGFSGIIFQLSVLEANLGPPGAVRSVYGLFQVPAYLYPWALLIALQILLPQISFVGHLSGILVGTLQLYGALDATVLPGDWRIRSLEGGALRRLTEVGGYVCVPAEGAGGIILRDPAALTVAVQRRLPLGALRGLLGSVASAIGGIVSGFGGRGGTSGTVLARGEEHVGLMGMDDDDWNGLPSLEPPDDDVELAVV